MYSYFGPPCFICYILVFNVWAELHFHPKLITVNFFEHRFFIQKIDWTSNRDGKKIHDFGYPWVPDPMGAEMGELVGLGRGEWPNDSSSGRGHGKGKCWGQNVANETLGNKVRIYVNFRGLKGQPLLFYYFISTYYVYIDTASNLNYASEK